MIKKNNGITLVALVVTVIVMLIIATVSISGIINGNILGNTKKVAFQNDLRAFQEKIALYVLEKEELTGAEFDIETLFADEDFLNYYNITDKEKEEGNIYSIIPNIDEKYKGRIYIENGEMVLISTDDKEKKWAKEIGVRIDGIIIDTDGTLLSAEGVEGLIDETGTLRVPSRVTKIAQGAFNNVPNLKKIIIPGTVKKLADNAFSNNTVLEEVIMEEGVEKLGNLVFSRCSNLKNVQMADTITTMGQQVFYYCFNLQKINYSKGLTTIPPYTFTYCNHLKEFEIPNSVTQIGNDAFADCSVLEELYISENITQIDLSAFNRAGILMLKVSENNQSYKMSENTLCNKAGTSIIAIFRGSEIIEYTVPDGVTQIGSIFSTCTKLEKINLPASLTSITTRDALAKVTINLITVDENNNYFSADAEALYNKDKTKLIRAFSPSEEYTVIDSVKILGAGSMSKKSKIINLPDGLTTIENLAFEYCGAVTEQVNLGKNVTGLTGLSLHGLSNTNLTITIDPENPNYIIEDNALYNKNKTILMDVFRKPESFTVPEGVLEIADYVFHGEGNLKSVTIPSTVNKIGNSFNFCYIIEKIEIPSSVTSISSSCFSQCNKLSEIIIHKGGRVEGCISGAPWSCPAGAKAVKWVD